MLSVHSFIWMVTLGDPLPFPTDSNVHFVMQLFCNAMQYAMHPFP